MVHAELHADTLDSLGFPTAGHLLGLQWSRPLGTLAGEPGATRVMLQALQAYRWGPWSGHVYVELGRAGGGAEGTMSLGGFWRLTGLESDALQGSVVAFGRLVVARELAALPPVLGRAVRAGVSLELGNTFAPGDPLRLGAMRRAGSLFLSADTRFGPTYLALGATGGLPPKLYLFLGPIW
jgi:NTE family protein